jgi:transcriptional regulator with XRE-family HTH domain
LLINATQIRLARTALGWGVRELERATGISFNTLSRIERGESSGRGSTLVKIEETFEARGFSFPDKFTVRYPADLVAAAKLDDEPTAEGQP